CVCDVVAGAPLQGERTLGGQGGVCNATARVQQTRLAFERGCTADGAIVSAQGEIAFDHVLCFGGLELLRFVEQIEQPLDGPDLRIPRGRIPRVHRGKRLACRREPLRERIRQRECRRRQRGGHADDGDREG